MTQVDNHIYSLNKFEEGAHRLKDKKSRSSADNRVNLMPTMKRKSSKLIYLFLVWILTIKSINAATCPSGVTISNPMKSLKYTYSSVTTRCATISAVIGPISGAAYVLDDQDSANSILMKRATNGIVQWMISLTSFTSLYDVLATSPDEQYVFAIAHGSFKIVQVTASSGTVYKSWNYTGTTYTTSNSFPFVFVSSDGTTLYFDAMITSSSQGMFCSLVISGSDFNWYSVGMTNLDLVIDRGSGNFIALGRKNTDFSLKVIKFTFGSTSTTWKREFQCNTGGWESGSAAGTMNSDSTQVHILASYGNTQKLVLFTLKENDGTLEGSIYRSNNDWTQAEDLILVANILYGLAECSSNNNLLLKFDLSTSTFDTFYTYTHGSFHRIFSASDSMLKGYGNYNTFCYIPEFSYSKLSDHPDFSADSSSFAMSIVTYTFSTSSDSLSSLSTISSTASGVFVTSSVTFSEDSSSWVENIVYFNAEEGIVLPTDLRFTSAPKVTCSTTGKSVKYALSAVNGESVPSWVAIDENTGVLSGKTPDFDEDQTFWFLVDSTSAEFTGTSQKLLKLEVRDDKATIISKIATYVALVFAILWMILGAIIAFVYGSFYLTTWSIFIQLQMIVVILSIDPNPTGHILYFVEWVNFSLVNFNFIPLADIRLLADWMDLEQENNFLRAIDLESKSSLLNHVSLFTVFLLIFILHLFIELIFYWFKPSEVRNRRFSCFFVRADILNIFRNVAYIRLLWLSMVSLLLSSLHELENYSSENTFADISSVVAFELWGICLWFFIHIIFYYLKFLKSEYGNFFLMEMFNGIKDGRIARFFTVIWVGRSLLFWAFAVFFSHRNRIAAYAVVFGYQILFFVYLVAIRPFERVIDTLVEAINQGFLIGYGCIVIWLDFDDNWTDLTAELFIFGIALNFACVLLSMILFLIIDAWWQKKKKKTEEKYKMSETKQKIDHRRNIYKDSQNVECERNISVNNIIESSHKRKNKGKKSSSPLSVAEKMPKNNIINQRNKQKFKINL
jgi:hypothetical protein